MTNEDIVADWMEGLTIGQIADKHEASYQLVAARIHYLRKIGVALPNRRVKVRIDVDHLNRLIAKKLKR